MPKRLKCLATTLNRFDTLFFTSSKYDSKKQPLYLQSGRFSNVKFVAESTCDAISYMRGCAVEMHFRFDEWTGVAAFTRAIKGLLVKFTLFLVLTTLLISGPCQFWWRSGREQPVPDPRG